jgi:hypothetical protein
MKNIKVELLPGSNTSRERTVLINFKIGTTSKNMYGDALVLRGDERRDEASNEKRTKHRQLFFVT